MNKAVELRLRENASFPEGEAGSPSLLGFDTGLDAKAFAQAKMAQFLTQQGCIVFPDGTIEPWKAAGVEESPDGSMIIYGPAFSGKSLMTILESKESGETVLNAIRFWIRARLVLKNAAEKANLFPGAAGVFVVLSPSNNFPAGTVFFAPERIVKRCLEAAGDAEIEAAQQWMHPDLTGEESAVFSAASMLYAVFCGEAPFTVRKETAIPEEKKKKETDGESVLEALRQDIREGVFMPPELAAPGLDNELCKLLNSALAVNKRKSSQFSPPSLEALSSCMSRTGSEKIRFWFKQLDEEENSKLLHEREQYQKSSNLQVKTRRFVLRNTTRIVVCAAAFIALIFGINSFIKTRAARPTTKGMNPVEVIETYYGAFGPMDHILMEACVINRAGKNDISMVTNLYIVTKVRGAYEANVFTSVSAQEWLDAGMPETEIAVFGVTNLKLKVVGGSESQGELYFEAEYLLWVPAGLLSDENEKPSTLEELNETRSANPPPVALGNRDRLKLVLHKNAWRISELDRTGL